MVRLLVVEDHALVREGLVQTLRQLEAGVEVCDVADATSAIEMLDAGRGFDMMLLDLGLPGVDGMTCLSMLRKRFPQLPVVILSGYDDAHTVSRALKAGAAGFVPKTYSSDRLLAALRQVRSGRVYTPEASAPGEIAPREPLGGYADPADFGLTARQAEVLGLMARGKSNRQIAELLGLSEGTVKIHLTAIFKVLNVSSRTQAMVVIAREGIRL